MSSERKNIEKIILGCRETLNPKYEWGVTDERRKFNCSSSRQYECPFKFFGKYCQFQYIKKIDQAAENMTDVLKKINGENYGKN